MKKDLTDGFVYAEGIQRTDVDCTDCGRVFIAKINHDLNGNHKILCPHCGHEHWRTIKKGVVTITPTFFTKISKADLRAVAEAANNIHRWP